MEGRFHNPARHKNLSLTARSQPPHGGKAYSLTNSILSPHGQSLTTSLEGRYDGLIHPGVNVAEDGTYSKNTTITTDAVDYYNTVIYPRPIAESNVFDTSYLKMKGSRIEYSLPRSLCAKTKVFQSASISFFATNLFCITNFPQYDPESGIALRFVALSGCGDGCLSHGALLRFQP